MPIDLSEAILRRSVRARSSGRCSSCSHCRRTPVAGELLHVYARGVSLCALCAASQPAGSEPLRREMVHAAERRLVVVSRAA